MASCRARARAFAERTSAPAGLFEIPLVLDTVWVFGERRQGCPDLSRRRLASPISMPRTSRSSCWPMSG